MQQIGNDIKTLQSRLTIRVSRHTLSFATIDKNFENEFIYEPYTIRSGISIAANLREAFKTATLLLRNYQRVQVIVDSNVMLVPIEEFHDLDYVSLYEQTMEKKEADIVIHYVLPNLNVIAVFAINKDLKMVIEDHFQDIRILPLMQPVWTGLHKRSFTGRRRKLYVYFHDEKMEVFSFDKNRFKFCNTYSTHHLSDSIYYILHVWKLLTLDPLHDELHLVGQIRQESLLVQTLQEYILSTFIINPSADYNRAPITQIKNLPYDMITLFIKKSTKI